MIKNILFDLGGVIEKVNPCNVVKELAQLGVPEADKIFTIKRQSMLIDQFDTGKIGANEFNI